MTADITMLWNPRFLAALSTRHVIGVMKHECYHLIFEHTTTRRHDPHRVWNYATDLAINSLIPENELPEGFLDNEYRTVTDKLSPWEEDIEEILKKSEESEILESENSAQDSDIEELRKKLEEIREQLESVKGLRVLKDDDGDLYCSNCKKIFYTQNGAEWHINSGWCLNA